MAMYARGEMERLRAEHEEKVIFLMSYSMYAGWQSSPSAEPMHCRRNGILPSAANTGSHGK